MLKKSSGNTEVNLQPEPVPSPKSECEINTDILSTSHCAYFTQMWYCSFSFAGVIFSSARPMDEDLKVCRNMGELHLWSLNTSFDLQTVRTGQTAVRDSSAGPSSESEGLPSGWGEKKTSFSSDQAPQCQFLHPSVLDCTSENYTSIHFTDLPPTFMLLFTHKRY